MHSHFRHVTLGAAVLLLAAVASGPGGIATVEPKAATC